MDNGPQCASAAFEDCSIEWGFSQETSGPHYPQSNGFAKSSVKIISIQYSVASIVVQIQGLHYSISGPHQLMPSSYHPHRCCTTARYIPSYHPGSATLTQHPSKFKSALRIKPRPILINTPNNVHYSVLVSQLPHLTS